VDGKAAEYNRANKEVAILCNHQRSVPKAHANQMEKLQEKLQALRDELKVGRCRPLQMLRTTAAALCCAPSRPSALVRYQSACFAVHPSPAAGASSRPEAGQGGEEGRGRQGAAGGQRAQQAGEEESAAAEGRDPSAGGWGGTGGRGGAGEGAEVAPTPLPTRLPRCDWRCVRYCAWLTLSPLHCRNICSVRPGRPRPASVARKMCPVHPAHLTVDPTHPPPTLSLQVKEDLKTVALGTSKINYLDPRITVAWWGCRACSSPHLFPAASTVLLASQLPFELPVSSCLAICVVCLCTLCFGSWPLVPRTPGRWPLPAACQRSRPHSHGRRRRRRRRWVQVQAQRGAD
jgi:hypothetical protein